MLRSRNAALGFAAFAALVFGLFGSGNFRPGLLLAQEPTPQPEPRDVLAAEAAGQVEVRFIPNDSRSAQVIVANREERPLTLRLPAAFAGVPVAAQMGMGGMGGMGGGQTGFGGAQTVGGGGMQGPVGGPGQPGGAFCWVARAVYGVHDPRWLAFREWMTWRAPASMSTQPMASRPPSGCGIGRRPAPGCGCSWIGRSRERLSARVPAGSFA